MDTPRSNRYLILEIPTSLSCCSASPLRRRRCSRHSHIQHPTVPTRARSTHKQRSRLGTRPRTYRTRLSFTHTRPVARDLTPSPVPLERLSGLCASHSKLTERVPPCQALENVTDARHLPAFAQAQVFASKVANSESQAAKSSPVGSCTLQLCLIQADI